NLVPYTPDEELPVAHQSGRAIHSNEDHPMKRTLLSAVVLASGAACCWAAEFEPPVRLKSGDAAIRVEAPGYAAPCWADMDGKQCLLVGQCNKGKIKVLPPLGAEKFGPGSWLKAEGKFAEVPGVW